MERRGSWRRERQGQAKDADQAQEESRDEDALLPGKLCRRKMMQASSSAVDRRLRVARMYSECDRKVRLKYETTEGGSDSYESTSGPYLHQVKFGQLIRESRWMRRGSRQESQ